MTNTVSQSMKLFGENIRRFIKLESSAGLVLMAATILAMVIKNSPLSPAYQALLMLEGEVRLGSIGIQKPLLLWVNDLGMAVFFFLITLFDYPPEIRKVIYTTNVIESLNSVIRKSVKKRKLFPNDNAALKVVYLAAMDASRKWKRPVRDWKNALNQFAIRYDGELSFQS